MYRNRTRCYGFCRNAGVAPVSILMGICAGHPTSLLKSLQAASPSTCMTSSALIARAGVREYLIWRTVERQFDWLVLEHDEYRPNLPDAQKLLHSPNFKA